MAIPKTATELDQEINSIERNDGADSLRTVSKKLDLMLHVLLEIRNNLRGY